MCKKCYGIIDLYLNCGYIEMRNVKLVWVVFGYVYIFRNFMFIKYFVYGL